MSKWPFCSFGRNLGVANSVFQDPKSSMSKTNILIRHTFYIAFGVIWGQNFFILPNLATWFFSSDFG